MINLILTIVTGLFWLLAGVGAPDPPPAARVNSAASVYEVTSPVPYQVVTDEIDIIGSVISPDLYNYFVEYYRVIDGVEYWFPATLPRFEPVFADRIGTFNTSVLPDGEYQIRLRVRTGVDTASTLAFGPIVVRNSQKVIVTETPEPVISVTASVDTPVPGQVVKGQVDIVGTVAAPDPFAFFFEFRPVGGEDKWYPATLPYLKPVNSGFLGSWNTETLQDGDYMLRLAVKPLGGPYLRFPVGTMKVRNGN